MNAKNATALLGLIRHYSLASLLDAGALEGVVELVAAAKVEPAEGIYLVVPYSEQHGLRKVDAIKTIRVMFGIGLKEAKDYFEELMTSSTTLSTGAVRIGPFGSDTSYSAMVKRINEAAHRDGLLLPVVM